MCLLFCATFLVNKDVYNTSSEEARTPWYGCSSYRPISNLTVLSKLLKRLVARHLSSFRSLTVLAVRISTRTLYWNCGVTGTLWHTASCRSWRCVCPRPVGHDGSVWHRQSFDPVAAAAVRLWYLRHCLSTVSVVPVRSRTACSAWFCQVIYYLSGLRRQSINQSINNF